MGLGNSFIRRFGPGTIRDIIKEQNWAKLGSEQAQVVKEFLDKKFSDKGSEFIQDELAPALDQFVEGFKEELLKD